MIRRRINSRQSSSFTRRRREKNILFISSIIIGAVVLVYSISHISSIKSLSVTSIEVYGADTDIVSDVQIAAEKALQGRYAGLFAKSNVFIYPAEAVASAVEAVSPRIEHAEVKLNDRNTLVVSVAEKNAAAVVCASLPDFQGNELALEAAEECSFVDRSGQIFSKAPSFTGTAHKHYYVPGISETKAIPTAEFASLQSFYDSVRAAGIGAEAILVKPDGEYELYIRNPADPESPKTYVPGTAVVYFNAAGGFSAELANLVSFWVGTLEKARATGEVPIFDSIDLRYGSNVFYRLNK